jgi:hypothetical protein
MRSLRRDLARRLARLEACIGRGNRGPVKLCYVDPIDEARREALAANERIVEDWYDDRDGVLWTRERITTDPNDEGQRCPPGGCLEEIMRELHPGWESDNECASSRRLDQLSNRDN